MVASRVGRERTFIPARMVHVMPSCQPLPCKPHQHLQQMGRFLPHSYCSRRNSCSSRTLPAERNP
jgi:hypothetical protein